jgi:DTW domain-containing protein YfiP
VYITLERATNAQEARGGKVVHCDRCGMYHLYLTNEREQ